MKKKLEVEEAESSVRFWTQQLYIDPDNKRYQRSFNDAERRLKELSEKTV